jgi:regulator of protease activity HflC (stomatin/prohibitin superfamily)
VSELLALLRTATEIFRWWIIVQPWESCIRVRLGRHVVLLAPGIHWRIPYVDEAFKQSVRLRIAHLPTQTVTTTDGRALTLGANLGYQVENIQTLYNTIHNAEGSIVNLAAEVIARVATTLPTNELTAANVGDMSTARLSLERYGLGGVDVRITDFAFVRTLRIIQDQRWATSADGDSLNLNARN